MPLMGYKQRVKKDLMIFVGLFLLICVGYFFSFSELHAVLYGSRYEQQGGLREHLSYLYLSKWCIFAIPALPLLLVCLTKITLLNNKGYSKNILLALLVLYVLLAACVFVYWLAHGVSAAYANPF